MKYVIEFEDEPFINRNGTKMYRVKGSTSVFVPSSYFNHFPKYEEPVTSPKMSEKDDRRLMELENLKEGDVVIATNDVGGIRRMGLVIFVYSGEEDPYEIVSNYGVVMRRSAKDLFELGYQKSFAVWTTEEFFSESKRHADEVRDEAAEELKNLQPGDIIIRENRLLSCGVERQLVLFRYEDGPKYQIISQTTGMIIVVSADELRDSSWRKYWNDYVTKDFFYSLRKEKCNDK